MVPPEVEYIVKVIHSKEFVNIHDAWGYLLDVGKDLARKHSVQPEELVLSPSRYAAYSLGLPLTTRLVTRAGIDQRFKIRDLRRVQYWPASHAPTMHGFHQPHFGGHQIHHGMGFGGHGQFGHQPFGGPGGGDPRRLIPGQDLAPKIFYLFTSGEKDHEAYFSLTPVHIPRPSDEKPPELNPSIVKCYALADMWVVSVVQW